MDFNTLNQEGPWRKENLKQGVIYFIKQACGNEIMPSVYGVIFTFGKKISKGHCEAMLDVKQIYFIDF